jgi:DNA-binding transcriptional LysR family regulator
MDVDTRLLRYFAAVAAEGNLTRAAERLFVSQPALTKQIKQLESQLGMRLFIRSRAGMTLTPAGRALAGRTAAVLAGWDQALRETKATASRADRVLRVGFMSSAANEATQQIIAAFARRRPGWRVDMQQAAWSDPTAGLASGDVDAALLRLPFPGQDDMRIEVLFTEPRWVALPATHPLATHDQICFHQLWDEPFVAAPAESGWWRDYWLATGERQGHPVRIGYVTDQPDAWLTAIANGYGIALAPNPPPATTHAPASPTGPSPASARARPGSPGRPPATPTPSSRTSSAAAWTTSRHNTPRTNLTSSNSKSSPPVTTTS